MNRSLFIVVVVLALLVVGGGTLLTVRNSINIGASALIHVPFSFVASIVNSYRLSDRLHDLEHENETLRAQILFLGYQPHTQSVKDGTTIIARVYSTYPFSNRGLITINAGSRDGVAVGMTVTTGGVLLGKIASVELTSSVVQTVFDSEWQLPVKLGEATTDGLLVGGREPKVTLIVDAAKVHAGETVLAASRDIPYGLVIASIANVGEVLGSNLAEASLSFNYDPRTLSTVEVLIP